MKLFRILWLKFSYMSTVNCIGGSMKLFRILWLKFSYIGTVNCIGGSLT